MIANNLKLSLRLFGRHKLYTITSVLGLSLGLAIGILISLFVRFELSFESENPLADRIVRTSMDYLNGDMVIDQDAGNYAPAGPRISSEFSGVEHYTSIFPVPNVTIKSGDESLREHKVYAVDHAFLNLFNCKVLAGKTEKALSAPFEMFLTKTAAMKYFGSTDVLGKSILMSRFDQPFKVTGLIDDAPVNSHIKYTVLVSKTTFGQPSLKWDNNDQYTYFLLTDASQYPNFIRQLNALNNTLYKEGQIPNERIVAQPLKDIHLYSHQSFELEQNGDAISVFFLMGVGALVMIIAIVNHINLSTARSLERAKEVGVRKVIGSSLNQLRLQFFTESLLVNVISVGFALVLVVLALPSFRKLSGLPVEFEFWTDKTLYITVALAVIVTTILSSIFPSFILASFQPIKALRGKFSRSAGGVRLRKVLVTLQFAITMFLLVQTFTAKRQLDYMREKDLGLDIEQTVVVRTASNADSKNYQVLKDKLLAQSEVSSVSFSGCVPGQPTSEMGSTNVGVNVIGGANTESFNFYITWIDADFFSTMKIDRAAGNDFDVSDKVENNIIVNEEALRLWHITDAKAAIGQRINLWTRQRTIIGVIKNFHQASPKDPYLPMIFLHQEGNNRLTSVRLQSGDVKHGIEVIKRNYQAVFPGSPFEYFFLDEEFDKLYRTDEQFEQVFGTLTVFAILISALGLFGLVSVAVANRTKEIGIRKVLGATSQEIIRLVSNDFMGLVLTSIVISTVVGYFVISSWLSRYAFRIELGADLFIMPALLIFGVSILTIAARTLRASLANPVKSLKED